MSRTCDICGKRPQTEHHQPRHNVSTVRRMPNLKSVKADVPAAASASPSARAACARKVKKSA